MTEDHFIDRIDELNTFSLNIWLVICTIMVILSQVGYMMKETGTIKMLSNSVILLKTILVISVSSLTFFFVGYGLGTYVEGGIVGTKHFAGTDYQYIDYTRFLFFLSLCIKMSVIATGSIGERIEIDRYIFFSFLNSSVIFPLGLAWCWNDGWI